MPPSPFPSPPFSCLSALSPLPVITRGARVIPEERKGISTRTPPPRLAAPIRFSGRGSEESRRAAGKEAARDGEEPGVQGDAEGAAGVVLWSPRRRGGRWHEWHAARLASLNKTHTLTWEEFKKKQKDEELKRGEVEADKDKMMREYRAQLDAERAQKLGRGRDVVKLKSSSSKKERKDKDPKKRIKKRRKHRSSSESSSSSSESSSSDDEDDRGSRKSRSRSRSKRNKKDKKDKKHRSRSKHTGNDSEGEGGPVRLSKFFGNTKN